MSCSDCREKDKEIEGLYNAIGNIRDALRSRHYTDAYIMASNTLDYNSEPDEGPPPPECCFDGWRMPDCDCPKHKGKEKS